MNRTEEEFCGGDKKSLENFFEKFLKSYKFAFFIFNSPIL